MLAMLLSLLSLQAAEIAAPEPMRLNGRCDYPGRIGPLRAGETRILCDSIAVGTEGSNGTIDFARRSWGVMIRFTGAMSGPRMTIGGLRLRSGEVVAATGTCEIFYAGGKVSVVSCLAKAGVRFYIANFVPSRI
jgi:hypothetical protein